MPFPIADPNVLLIVLDDIGLEWFSFYGIGQLYTTDPNFQYCRTPNLARLAAKGILFREGHANPICGPTRANIQTGRYAFRTGFGSNIRDPGTNAPIGDRLSDEWTWLPEAIELGRPGVYDTAAMGKWHLCDGYKEVVPFSPLPPPDANLDHPNENGYQHAAIHIPNIGCTYTWWRVVNGVVDPKQGYHGPPFDTSSWAPSVHTADAIEWISERTRPWFLYLAYNAPHAPYTVPPFATVSLAMRTELMQAGLAPGFSLTGNTTYAQAKLVWRAAMESVDFCIGQVIAALDPATLARTVVLVVGDNGTAASVLPPGFAHFKREVYGGGTRVPLIAAGAGVVQPGRSSNALAHAVDMYATVLECIGAPLPPTIVDFDSISLAPVLQNVAGNRTRVFCELFLPWGETDQNKQTSVQRALFDGRWRYVQRATSLELYDDQTDFRELFDVREENPDIFERLQRELDELLGS